MAEFKYFEMIRKDSSAAVLIASNVLVIAMAVLFKWSAINLLVGYWVQSIIIGFFTVLKMLLSKQSERNPMNAFERNQTLSIAFKIFFTAFFIVHYGGFHIAYGVFLWVFSQMPQLGAINIPDIAIMGIIFFANHSYSFYKNYLIKTERNEESITRLMMSPYERILPMHLTIIIGGFIIAIAGNSASQLIALFFLLVKTTADVQAHSVEHKEFKKTKTN